MLPNSLSKMAGPFSMKDFGAEGARVPRLVGSGVTQSLHHRARAIHACEPCRQADLWEMSTSECNVLLWSIEERRQEKVRVTARATEDGSLTEAPGLRTFFGGKLKCMKVFIYMSWRYYGSMIQFRLKSVSETQACSIGLKLLSARLLAISFTTFQPRESLATDFLGFHGKCT